MNHYPRPAKMLVCFVGRHRGRHLVEVAKAAGARGGTIALGKSVGNNRLLQALSLADIQQDIVCLVMQNEYKEAFKAIRKAALAERRKFGGTAVLLDIPEFFLRTRPKPTSVRLEDQRSRMMKSGYKMINAIVNSGYGDDVMAAARKAGATGGTIVNASGTGTLEDVQFFGITLVPEKEMLMIVAEEDKVQPIYEAISAIPTLGQPGGGVFFSLNVERFVLLGQQKPWAESEKAKRNSGA